MSNGSNSNKLQAKDINIDLQMNLLSTWSQYKVSDYYQNIVLPHIDQLSKKEAEEFIKK